MLLWELSRAAVGGWHVAAGDTRMSGSQATSHLLSVCLIWSSLIGNAHWPLPLATHIFILSGQVCDVVLCVRPGRGARRPSSQAAGEQIDCTLLSGLCTLAPCRLHFWGFWQNSASGSASSDSTVSTCMYSTSSYSYYHTPQYCSVYTQCPMYCVREQYMHMACTFSNDLDLVKPQTSNDSATPHHTLARRARPPAPRTRRSNSENSGQTSAQNSVRTLLSGDWPPPAAAPQLLFQRATPRHIHSTAPSQGSPRPQPVAVPAVRSTHRQVLDWS